MGKDKLLHFGVSCVATLICGVCMFFLGKAGAILCGAWFALGLGLGKNTAIPRQAEITGIGGTSLLTWLESLSAWVSWRYF